ncbi:MAG TPA: polysaccharide deacetylase family protein [Synechococcales cyanobacterium M55_K2018_004]|nr:polysaccharide deacetylase family protein [Synechococcales cyanobacterium M55_K2018_004]
MANTAQTIVAQVAKWFPDAIFYKPTDTKVVALTIDDVPCPNDPDDSSTRLILDTIAQHNQQLDNPDQQVRGTFFVISDHLHDGTMIIQEMLAQGHEIANHGTADETTALTPASVFEQHLKIADRRISEFCHQPLRWYRPGRGLYTPAMLAALKTMPGYETRFALASMLPIDTFAPTNAPEFTIQYVSQFIFPGAILLLHGGTAVAAANTAIALKTILMRLQSQEYQVVTLSELWDKY